MIKLVLCEDQALLRSALTTLLTMEDDIEILNTTDDGSKALPYIIKHQPDILLTDIEMPNLNGIELAEHIQRHQINTKTIIITTFGRTGYISRARKAGVAAYLLKDQPSHKLIEAIRIVHNGGQVYMEDLNLTYDIQDPLNNQHRRILRLVEKGMTNKEIGRNLNLSSGTVRNYLSDALEKLGVSNRIEGFRIARDQGWL